MYTCLIRIKVDDIAGWPWAVPVFAVSVQTANDMHQEQRPSQWSVPVGSSLAFRPFL